MPDLDFRALREEAERAALPPEFAVVEQRLGRRRRRRIRYAAATVAVGTAVALAIGFGLVQGPPQSSPGIGPHPDPGGPRDARPEIQFVDPGHGLAQYLGSGTDCRAALRTTEDGGKTWSAVRRSPRVTRPNGKTCANVAQLIGKDTIVVPRLDWLPAAENPVISRDGGKNWRPYQPGTTMVDTVPDNVVPEEICLSRNECNQEGYGQLGWLDPETGDRKVLKSSPPGMKHVGRPFVARDGSIWALEPTAADKPVELTVAVSQDRGRTWRTMTTPDRGHLASYDGQTGYFMTVGPQVALLRTRDGGATWKPVENVRFDGPDLAWIHVMWATADGALVVGGYPDNAAGSAEDEGPSWRISRDGGKSFQEITLPKDLNRVQKIPGGFHGWSITGSPHYVSQDGLTWRKVTAP